MSAVVVPTARQWVLRRRPRGAPVPEDVALVDVPVPVAGAGELLVRNHFLSVDPYMRGRMNAGESYAAPYEVGRAMWGGAVGQVVASGAADVPVGSFVQHELGWRTHAVVPAASAAVVQPHDGPLSRQLGALGLPGLTAWVGLFDIARVRPGETVWVSAAAGAVGSLAGQLAKQAGCFVVGSAGGADKCRYVVEELGLDACIDHRAGDLDQQLRAVLPQGLDVYFDSVGGEHLRTALALANSYARLVECGMISGYDGQSEPVGDLFPVVAKRLTVRGFIVRDWIHRRPAFVRHVAPLLAAGSLLSPETVVPGIERQFDALLSLLRGGPQLGKVVVDVRPQVSSAAPRA